MIAKALVKVSKLDVDNGKPVGAYLTLGIEFSNWDDLNQHILNAVNTIFLDEDGVSFGNKSLIYIDTLVETAELHDFLGITYYEDNAVDRLRDIFLMLFKPTRVVRKG